jgi:hypothetical protein
MRKKELILVELNDGTICRMAKTALKLFLSRGKVTKFKRTDDWFVFGEDQLRDEKNDCIYTGLERREIV